MAAHSLADDFCVRRSDDLRLSRGIHGRRWINGSVLLFVWG